VVRGLALARLDPDSALTALDAGLAEQQRRGYRSDLLPVALGRAEVGLARGDFRQAEEQLRLAIAEYERLRAETPSDLERLESFGWAQRAVDLLVAMLLDDRVRRPEDAWLALERARARFLLDRWSIHSDAGRLELDRGAVAELQANLMNGEVVATYTPVDGAIHAFVWSRRGLRWAGRVADADEVAERVGELHGRLYREADSREARRLAGWLHDRLVTPLDLEPDTGRLVVVAEGFLSSVPFAILVDGTTNRLLIDQMEISIAPSAVLAVLARRRALERASTARPPEVLAVGNPRLPQLARGDFPDLPDAAIEIEEVRSLYPSGLLLRDEQATARAFLEASTRFDVIHMAGHAASNAQGDAFFVLAPENGADGRLGMLELLERGRFDQELVVLSACATAASWGHPREGLMGLTGAFFANGVPAVLATTRPVEDRSIRPFMVDFHHAYLDVRDASRAFREAALGVADRTRFGSPGNRLLASVVLVGG
jgi:CHAT domain-containing protein